MFGIHLRNVQNNFKKVSVSKIAPRHTESVKALYITLSKNKSKVE